MARVFFGRLFPWFQSPPRARALPSLVVSVEALRSSGFYMEGRLANWRSSRPIIPRPTPPIYKQVEFVRTVTAVRIILHVFLAPNWPRKVSRFNWRSCCYS